jgi:outer membrane protein assembly factor BamB
MRLRIAALALASLGLAQTASAADGDWPQLGYTAHGLRENTHESVLTRKTVPRLVLKWSQPIAIGNSSPVVANGMLYVGALDGSLHAFDAASGAPAWSYKTGFRIDASPAVADGVVYIGSDDGRLYALDAETGALKWSTIMEASVTSSPTVAHGTVFVGTTGGKLFALNAKTGIVRWQASQPDLQPISTPAVAHGLVYAADTSSALYAYDEKTGKAVWASFLNFQTNQFTGAPAVDADNVYVVSGDGIYAADARIGGRVWASGTGVAQSSIAVAKGHIYLGTIDHTLWRYDTASGALVYDKLEGNAIQSTPAIANGVVYIGMDDGTIDAYEAATGTSLWSAQIGGQVISSPTVSNGMLYAGGTMLNAYGLP